MTKQDYEANSIIGHWRVLSIDMIEDCAVSLIAGLVGEWVEFTESGRYQVGISSSHSATYRYRVEPSKELPELDIWIIGMKSSTAHCVYLVSEDRLTICIAGNNGERPTELRRDDESLWCVKNFKRCAPPKRRKLKP